MSVSLRTRLFVTVAVVLAASVIASGFFSRRATLVEVREVVRSPVAVESPRAVADRLTRELGESSLQGATGVLEDSERGTGQRLLLVDMEGRLVAASNGSLRGARVRRATADGDLELDLSARDRSSSLVLRGAAPALVSAADGTPVAYLYALPPAEPDAPLWGALLPGWIAGTGSIAAVALILAFALSRRVLRPVIALTDAVRRMERGELDVRVAAPLRGGDEIAELARSFNAMAARLASNEELRRHMVSDVAHELRAPVTNLRCSLEAIQDGLVTADRAAIDALHDETLLLQRLIADLQDLALAEAGQLDLRPGPVSASDLVARAIATLPSGDGPAISVSTASDTPPVLADPDRLVQILRNLLSNARRHTPANGAIRVSIGADADGMVQVVVADTGEGISPEHLTRVFDRFYRADRSRARATGGAGLGLAIVRQLVQAQGGTVEVASAGEGLGATFTVRMPTAALPRASDAA